MHYDADMVNMYQRAQQAVEKAWHYVSQSTFYDAVHVEKAVNAAAAEILHMRGEYEAREKFRQQQEKEKTWGEIPPPCWNCQNDFCPMVGIFRTEAFQTGKVDIRVNKCEYHKEK